MVILGPFVEKSVIVEDLLCNADGLPQGVVAPLGLHNKVDILGLSLPARSRCSLGLLGSDVLNCLG